MGSYLGGGGREGWLYQASKRSVTGFRNLGWILTSLPAALHYTGMLGFSLTKFAETDENSPKGLTDT